VKALLFLLWLWPLALLAQSGPDERILWQLYHAHKYRLLKQAIAEYQTQYPDWKPPAELMRLLAAASSVKKRPSQLEAILRRAEPRRLVRFARRHPEDFNCSRVEAMRALAKAQARLGEEQAAAVWYRRALHCPKANTESVLAEALWELKPEAFAQLLKQARAAIPPSVYAEFAYQALRRKVFAALQRGEWPASAISSSLLHQARDRRDLDLISAVAWAQIHRGDLRQARIWFAVGLELAPESSELAAGLLHALAGLGEDEELLRLGLRLPELRRPVAERLLARAWEYYRQGDYATSYRLATQAQEWLPHAEEVQQLLGWVQLKRGEYPAARRIFERLVKVHPERSDYARGLIASSLEAGESLPSLAQRFPYPAFLAELSPHLAQRAFARKQFLSAVLHHPQAFPELKRLTAPSWGLGGMTKFKSGTAGLDRLELSLAPWYAGEYALATQRFALNFGRIELESERLKSSGISTLMTSRQDLNAVQRREIASLRDAPPPHLVEAAWLELSYRREGKLNPYFNLGLTPVGGELSPRPTARLGIGDWVEGSAWRWQVEAFRQPIRQSILSYTGWKLFGKRWGRVLRNGLKLSSLGLVGPIAVYQAAEGAFIDGKGTQDNWMLGYTLAVGYALGWPGFDYASLGPYFQFSHYAHNQNRFLPGHGGYFSPQEFYAGGVQLALRTEEGKRFLVESRVSVGVQHFREAKAPWLPRGCNGLPLCGLDYPANRETSFAPSGEMRFAVRLHPHLQLLGGLYARQTQGWREVGGGISLSVSFEPGSLVFSADLPEVQFSAIE
jgi:tetratricopeptide (TPR) repeat protein